MRLDQAFPSLDYAVRVLIQPMQCVSPTFANREMYVVGERWIEVGVIWLGVEEGVETARLVSGRARFFAGLVLRFRHRAEYASKPGFDDTRVHAQERDVKVDDAYDTVSA